MKILLIQDNPEYANLLSQRLSQEPGSPSFAVECESTLESGLKRLAKGAVDIILLELSLPDSRGIQTFEAIQSQYSAIPIVILTHLDDEILALDAVRKGAQDYLLKGEVEGKLLPRVVRYAVERHRLQTELRNLSFVDDLTGLYNRRGFLVLAEQQLKISRRNQTGFLFLLADLDGLKQVNDNFGHPQGDRALIKVGQVLKKTFRNSDILARLGGDEFAVLAIGAGPKDSSIILERLQTHLESDNAEKKYPFRLSLSTGLAHFDPMKTAFIEQLMVQADQALYEKKRARQKTR